MNPTDISGAPSFGAGSKLTGGAGGASGDVYQTTTTNNSSGFNSSGWTVGSGSAKVTASTGLNHWMIGGLVVAALAAVWILKRK